MFLNNILRRRASRLDELANIAWNNGNVPLSHSLRNRARECWLAILCPASRKGVA